MHPQDKDLSDKLTNLLIKNSLIANKSKSEISVAIIDLNKPEPEIFGYNMDHFIYPASIYKIFIAAEVLRRIENGDFSLEQIVEIKSPNDVDKDPKLFPSDTTGAKGLLNSGDKVSIDTLLDLMLRISSNTASNTLIDLVGRESITENIIHKHNWNGSEVTRKFLDHVKENKPYQFSSTTLTCTRHLVEFFYLVENKKLVSPFVSSKLKEYMLRFDRKSKKGLWLENLYSNYYCKGGKLENNLYRHSILSAIKSIFKKGWAIIRWYGDAGVVTGKKSRYVIAVLTVNKTLLPLSEFPMQKFAKVIYDFMENGN